MENKNFTKPDMNGLRWVVAQIKPNMLKKAFQNLQNQGFEYFAPCRWETVKSNNNFRRLEKLLFPGYIFVRCDISSGHISTLNATMGLSSVVRGTGTDAGIIPDGFIEELMFACGSGRAKETNIKTGDMVRLVEGPFVGVVGEVLSKDSNGRLRILFELMTATSKLTVDFKSVETVNEQIGIKVAGVIDKSPSRRS